MPNAGLPGCNWLTVAPIGQSGENTQLGFAVFSQIFCSIGNKLTELEPVMLQDVHVAVWMETTPIGADFPHPAVAAVTSFLFFHLRLLKHRGRKKRDKKAHHYSGSYFSSGPHLIFIPFLPHPLPTAHYIAVPTNPTMHL